MAEFTKEAQEIIERIENAAAHYGEVFDLEKVKAAMEKHYDALGVPMPQVVYVENWEEGFSAAWGAAWDAEWGAAWGAARDAARGAARGAAWGAARDAAWDAAWVAAWDAAWGAAWDAARDAARGAARGAAAANTTADPKILHFLEIELPILEALEAGLGLFFPMADRLIVTPVPKFRMNNANLLHSDNFPAVQWKNGKGYYYLNGVKFPEDLWTKVVSKEMPFKDILAIVDTDQRTQAMRYGDVGEFIKHAKGELLDTHEKTRLDGTKISYKLYKFPAGDIFTQNAYYMVYDDVVPESDKMYMSGVVKSKTVPEAMAWKFSDEHYTLTEKEWCELVPGISMN